MRKLLIISSILFATAGIGQNNNWEAATNRMLAEKNRDTTINLYLNKNTTDIPNALQVIPFIVQNLGNNGQGFDLYKGLPDNMIVLVPDKSLQESIPNAINHYSQNKISPLLLQMLQEQMKNNSPQEKIKQPFKLIKPEHNRISADTIKLIKNPFGQR